MAQNVSILVTIPYELEKSEHSAINEESILKLSIRLRWLILLFRSILSLIFYLFDLSVTDKEDVVISSYYSIFAYFSFQLY